MSINHEVLQWKFTSCQYNIENVNGFKTYSLSEGVTPNDKAELERLAGSYQCPQGVPDQPSTEELALFPVSFLSTQLRSGKRALIQTTYVGKDYSGVRWGNFFSHALILPEGNWDFYPIQMWKSPLFQSGLSLEEQNIGSTPPPLPLLQLTDEHVRDWSDELQSFEVNEANRTTTLSLTKAMFELKASGKSIFLRDTSDECLAKWIAAIQYAFPMSLAQDIFFTTNLQSLNSARGIQINGTIQDKGNFFYSATQSAPFYVFDIPEEKCPDVQVKNPAIFQFFPSNPIPYPGQFPNIIKEISSNWGCRCFDPTFNIAIQLETFFSGGQLMGSPIDTSQYTIESLKALWGYFNQQPYENRIRGVKKLFDQKTLFSYDQLAILVPSVARTVVESNEKVVLDKFCNFLVRQYAVPLKPLPDDFSYDRYFNSLEEVFNPARCPLGEELLMRLRYLPKERYNMHYLLLEMSLTLILEDDFIDSFQQFGSQRMQIEGFPLDVQLTFLQLIWEKAIPRCKSKEKHQALINLYSNRNANYFKMYIRQLTRPEYKVSNWREGRSAEVQATAFMKYCFMLHKNANPDWKTLNEKPVSSNPRSISEAYPPLREIFHLSKMLPQAQEQAQKKIVSILKKDCELSLEQKNILAYLILNMKTRKFNASRDKLYIWIVIAAALTTLIVLSLVVYSIYSKLDSNEKTGTPPPAQSATEQAQSGKGNNSASNKKGEN